MAQVSLEKVSKIYDGQVAAVQDLDLQIADKEFMVIVGPSGCGKTTILRMIAGLEQLSHGTIRIAGKVVNDIAPKNRNVAMVFQNYALYPHMTVGENIAFGLKLRKTPKADIAARVHEAAEMLGIENLLPRKPKALSGGQRQRVAVARAIVRDPAAFLFDEPLSNLDAKLRAATRAELKALHRRLNSTSIYVTHDQAEAMTLGDRICVMLDGVAQQIAEPLEIYQEPVNRFVAGFLGTPPMNFLAACVEFDNDRGTLALAGTNIPLSAETRSRLWEYNHQEVTLGIRPENISDVPFENQTNNDLRCTVRIVEPLGDHIEVHLQMPQSEEPLIASLGPHSKAIINEQMNLFLDLRNLHVFEQGATGRNLLLG